MLDELISIKEKNMKKKIFLVLAVVAMLTCIFALTASAVKIDGIDYSFSGTEATVTTGNQSCEGEIVIPGTVTYEGTTYTVTTIAGSAFKSSAITSVTIPSTVTSVGGSAFQQCGSLTTAVFNGADTALSEKVFMICSALSSVSLPTNIVKIPNYAFFGCTSSSFGITNIDSLTKLTTIGSSAFQDTNNLTFTIPDSVTTIESSAFQSANKNSGAITINKTSKLQTIGDSAFHDCKKLPYLYIPSTVTSIGKKAFYSCNALVIENFENCKITEIKDGTFEYANSLKTLKIPETVTTIGTAFADNNVLTLVYIPRSVTSIANTFAGGKPVNAVYVYTGSNQDIFANCSKFASAKKIEGEEYDPTASYTGINLVIGYSHCLVYNGGIHGNQELGSIEVNSYLEPITVYSSCKDCGYNLGKRVISAFFECNGYSAPENGDGGISLNFRVNNEAIQDYMDTTKNTVTYGLFATTKDAIADNEIVSSEGNLADGAIMAEIPFDSFISLTIKLAGFKTDELKASYFAIGAYVAVDDGEGKKYSYLQNEKPQDGAKYSFVSYYDIVA